MSNLKYAILETESFTIEAQNQPKGPKPFLVDASEGSANQVTRRVEEALDFELAQGRMPA